jgi:hypothetical protein
MENCPSKKQKTEIYYPSDASNTSDTYNIFDLSNISNSSGNSASSIINDEINVINALKNCTHIEFVERLDIKEMTSEESLRFKESHIRLIEDQKRKKNNSIYQYFSSVINGIFNIL